MEQGAKINAPPLELSAHLAKPLANPWRNRILAELLLRPMSPKQFTEAFGGPGLPAIARYFRELKDWGFIEVAEELRGGKRRGAVEKVYRATQRVHFDTPTWERLPYYLRSECSASMMEGLMLRISQAVRAETFDADEDRHLSWKALVFNRSAWSEFVERLDDLLQWISELEAESAERVYRDASELIPATVGLLAFRSPSQSMDGQMPPQQEAVGQQVNPKGPHFLMSPETAKALANPWRNRILAELHIRPMSPKRFLDEFGGPDLATIARYFRQLKKWGYLQVIEELRGGTRRGSVEKVYVAVRRVHFNTGAWKALPHELRSECSASMLDGLVRRIDEAAEAETFDAETDRHLSWKAVWLDKPAWTAYVTRLDETLAWVNELELRSTTDQDEGSRELIPATIALLAFRSPETAHRAFEDF